MKDPLEREQMKLGTIRIVRIRQKSMQKGRRSQRDKTITGRREYISEILRK